MVQIVVQDAEQLVPVRVAVARHVLVQPRLREARDRVPQRLLRGQTLERQMGRNYAGAWLERKADGSFGFGGATTSIKAAKAPAGVETRQARHSLAALNAAKGQLDSQLARSAKAPKGVYSWAVDLPSNSVILGIAPGAEEAGVDFIARSGIDASTVRFETMSEAPQRRIAVQGGRGYLRNPGDGYLYAC